MAALSTLLYSAFRIAGITHMPGRTPSTEQYADALDMANRMVGSWNIDRLKISALTIAAYTLTAAQKIYTIGPSAADFNTTRPINIEEANIIVNTTTPVVRFPVTLLSAAQWAAISVQTITGTVPWALYFDNAIPISSIYLIGQPLSTYQLELYTWTPTQTFTAITDAVVLPPGYDLAFVYNLGVILATAFPTQSAILPQSVQIAKDSLMAIESLNAPDPVMKCERLAGTRGGRDYYAYLGNDW